MKALLRTALCVTVGLAAIALGSSEVSAKQYKIALSNSYIGNEWRVEMINLMKAYVAKDLKDKVELTVDNSGTDVQKQIDAISAMISSGVDAILVDAVSDAVNPIIEEAQKQGIVVVTFDHYIKAPTAYVGVSLVNFGEVEGKWLAETLGGKGNIIVNRGVAGFEGDRDIYQGFRNSLDKYPDIHIVTEVYGKWDDAVSQAELTKALTAHPNIDAILNESGEYGALQAILNLKHPFVPMTGESTNGWRLAMLKYKDQGLRALSISDPPVMGVHALKLAVDILDGREPKDKIIWLPVTTQTSSDLKMGVNVHEDLPPTVFADVDEIPNSDIHLTLQDAMGK
jgi:ribose transport system substrate-binding protein